MALPVIQSTDDIGLEYFIEGVDSLETTLKNQFEGLNNVVANVGSSIDMMVELMMESGTAAALNAEIAQESGLDDDRGPIKDDGVLIKGAEDEGGAFFNMLTRMFSGLATLFAPLAAVVALPVAKTVVIATAAVTAIIKLLQGLGENEAFQEAITRFKGFIDKMTPLFQEIGDVFDNQIIPAMQTVLGGALTNIVVAVEGIVGVVGDFGRMLEDVWSGWKDVVDSLLSGDIVGAVKALGGIGMSIIEGLNNMAATALSTVGTLIDETITNTLNAVSQFFTGELLIDPDKNLSGVISEFFINLWADITGLWNSITKYVTDQVTAAKDAVNQFFTDLGDSITQAVTDAKVFIQSLIPDFPSIEEIGESLQAAAADAKAWALSMIPEFPSFEEMGNAFTDFVTDAKEWFLSMVPELPDISGLKDKLLQQFANIGIPEVSVDLPVIGKIGFGPYYPFAPEVEDPKVTFDDAALAAATAPPGAEPTVAAVREQALVDQGVLPETSATQLDNNPNAEPQGQDGIIDKLSDFFIGEQAAASVEIPNQEPTKVEKAVDVLNDTTKALAETFTGWFKATEDFFGGNQQQGGVVVIDQSGSGGNSTVNQQLVTVDPSLKPRQFHAAGALD